MKINKVNASPSFKAHCTSEVTQGFIRTICRLDGPNASRAEKLHKNINSILNLMPSTFVSIQKFQDESGDTFNFVIKNAEGKIIKKLADSPVKNKGDLFTLPRIDNIKRALLDMDRAERGIKTSDPRPYLDKFS